MCASWGPATYRAAIALAIAAGAASAQAQRAAYVQRDSVVVERDLDGDGRIDRVVVRRRIPRDEDAGPSRSRVVVLLGDQARAGRPAWATAWADDGESDVSVSAVTTLLPGVSMVEVDDSGGDHDGTTIVMITRGRARVVLTDGADYGQGFFDVTRDGARTTIDATTEQLSLEGRPVSNAPRCPRTTWPAAHLRFEPARRAFVVERTYCAPVR